MLRMDNRIHLHELENKVTKKDIKKDWGETCAYCGAEHTHSNPLTIDHIIPLSKGGHKTDIKNRIPSCLKCNRAKSNRSLEDWFFKQKHFNIYTYVRILKWMFPEIETSMLAKWAIYNCKSYKIPFLTPNQVQS